MKYFGIILLALSAASPAWAKCDDYDAGYVSRQMVRDFVDEHGVRCWDYDTVLRKPKNAPAYYATEVFCREYRTNKIVPINGQDRYVIRINAETCQAEEGMQR